MARETRLAPNFTCRGWHESPLPAFLASWPTYQRPLGSSGITLASGLGRRTVPFSILQRAWPPPYQRTEMVVTFAINVRTPASGNSQSQESPGRVLPFWCRRGHLSSVDTSDLTIETVQRGTASKVRIPLCGARRQLALL